MIDISEITPFIQIALGTLLLIIGLLISNCYKPSKKDSGSCGSKEEKDDSLLNKPHGDTNNEKRKLSILTHVLIVSFYVVSILIILNAIYYCILFHSGITIYSSVKNEDALMLLVTVANLITMICIAIAQSKLQDQIEQDAKRRRQDDKIAHINELVAQTLSDISVEGFRARLLNLNIRECSLLQSLEVLDYNRDSAPLLSIDLGQDFNHIGYLEFDFLVGILEHEKKYICVRPKSFPTEKQDKIVLLMDRKNIVDGALLLPEQFKNRVQKLNQDNQVEQDSECFNNILLAPFETDHKSKEVMLHLWIKVKDTRYTNKEMYPFLISISLKIYLQNYNRYGCCKAALITYNLQLEDIYYQ